MSILYLMTAPPPALEGTDAVLQEAEALRARFGGVLVHIGLSSRPWAPFPRAVHGLQKLRSLKRLERDADLVHVYHAELFAFPVLRLLRKPIVYTVVSGLGTEKLPGFGFLRRLAAVIVPRPADLSRLRHSGVAQGHLMTAGIDASRFSFSPPPPGEPFVLVSGSAPWSREQFHSKGVDALLEVVRRLPFLKLVLLWRGWLLEELQHRIVAQGLTDRVEVLADRVDVNDVLGRAHAAVVLAQEPRLVKAFPHSLLEALACGRPVIVSDEIALADYVEQTGCGRVVRAVDPGDLEEAVRRLREGYSMLQANALRVGCRDFSIERLLEGYGDLYASITASKARHPRRGRHRRG